MIERLEVPPSTEENPSEQPGIPVENAKFKRKGLNLSLVWKILTLVVFLTVGVFAYLILSKSPALNNGDDPVPDDPIVKDDPEPANPIKTFVSDRFKFSVQYNEDLHEFEEKPATFSDPAQFSIVYTGANQGDLDTELDLTDGYIVNIFGFEGIDREIEDLARRKREKYTLECPGIVELGSLYTRNIDGIEATSFEVINCPQNYIENFASFRGNVIEITQVYRGDLGFRQSYKAQTEQILSTFKWLRDPEEEPEIESYKNSNYQIEFIHPLLDRKCCSVTSPSIEGLKKVVVMADPERKNSDGVVLDKFGIFALERDSKSFGLFLNEQKQALIQEYRVVEAKSPTNLQEERVSIGGSEAILLRNYAWWGDVIYMEHPAAKYFLVFVIPDDVSSEFKDVVEGVFDTFVFEFEDD